MPLNETLKTHLKSNLMRGVGSGLHLKSRNSKLIDAPILVIGLGGTGANSLIRLKSLINERINSDFNNEKPKNIEYLAIDTDMSTKDFQHKGVSFSKANSEVCIYAHANLGRTYEDLCKRPESLPHITSWISHGMDVSKITNGAGGVRQVGRFLMFKEFNDIENKITTKVESILNGYSADKMVFVFIATGVSGGTGSGTFLDIPYIVKEILRRKGFNAQMLGFIFLPDVNISVIDRNDHAKVRAIKRNGFAALKELDFLMNLGNEGNRERFVQEYSSNFKVDYGEPPYDVCHLVSTINKRGLITNSIDDCMNVVSETIANFISGESGVISGVSGGSTDDFSVAQYISNISDTINTFVAGLSVKYPINYKYLAIGSSSGVLPMDDILNYIASTLFERIYEIYNRLPEKSEVLNFANMLGINREGIYVAVCKNSELPTYGYDFDTLKANPNILRLAFEESIEKSLSIIKENVSDFIDSFKENANKKIEEVFLDNKKGPYFASRLISSIENYCLLAHIKDLRNKLVLEKVNDADMERLRKNVELTQRKIATSEPLLGFGKNGLADNHIKACNEYYSKRMFNNVFDGMIKCFEAFYKYLNDKNDDLFDLLAETITLLKNIFADYGSIDGDISLTSEESTTTLTWDIIDKKVLAETVKLMINDESEVKFNTVIDEFIKELNANSATWLNCSKPNAVAKLNDFINNRFDNILNKSLDFYISKIANDDKIRIDSEAQQITEKLAKNAQVMFPVNVFGDNLNASLYSYMSVPSNADIIKSKLEADTGGKMIKQSIITNRVFMLKVNLVYPLMAYRELESYEAEYEKFSEERAGIGMHLYENNTRNWRELPSPIYDNAWSPTYKNERLKASNNKIRSLFDKALKYKYIQWDTKENKVACKFKQEINIKTFLNECNIENINDIDSISVASANLALNKLKSILAEDSWQGVEYLYDYKLKDGEPDLEFSKAIFINMPTLNKHMQKMIDQHEQLLEIEQKLMKIQGSVAVYSHFAAVLYTSLIRKSRGIYKYTDNKQLEKILLEPNTNELEYIEYYLYKAFKQMPDAEREYLNSTARKTINECNDDEFKKCIDVMENFENMFKEKTQKLTTTYLSEFEGDKKSSFYQVMREEMKKALEKYSE